MSRHILTTAAALFLIAIVLAPISMQAQTGRRLPPLLMTCPVHGDVIEESAGTCRTCGRALVPVRLEPTWSCPLHSAVMQANGGSCPICQRPLVQMMVALTWTCRAQPSVDALTPGRCADGTAMIERRTLRPHGNHNPQHGGQFFMAPDYVHHLEGTYPSDRLFRLYLYDDFARPLPADRMRGVSGRLEITGREVPLVASHEASYLEARLSAGSLPGRATARVRFAAGAPEYSFDFSFARVTLDPSRPSPSRPSPSGTSPAGPDPSGPPPLAGGAPAATPRAATRGTVPAAPARTPAPVAAPPAAAPPAASPAASPDDLRIEPDPALVAVPIPDGIPDILEQLRIRDEQVGRLIAQGNLAAVFVPAFQARDLAIALEARLDRLSVTARQGATPAIARIVRTAWLLDAYGDLGDGSHLAAAYETFTADVTALRAAFQGVR